MDTGQGNHPTAQVTLICKFIVHMRLFLANPRGQGNVHISFYNRQELCVCMSACVSACVRACVCASVCMRVDPHLKNLF